MLGVNPTIVCKAEMNTANPIAESILIKLSLQFTTKINEGTTNYKFTAKHLERMRQENPKSKCRVMSDKALEKTKLH